MPENPGDLWPRCPAGAECRAPRGIVLFGTSFPERLKSGRQGAFRIGPLTDECLIQIHSSLVVAETGRRGVSEWHRMTAEALKECNKRQLAQLARDKGSPVGTR